MKKIIKNVFFVLTMMAFIIACAGGGEDSSPSIPSSTDKDGTLTVLLRPVNDYQPGGGWKVDLVQGSKSTSETVKGTQAKFTKVEFGDYTIKITALDADGKSLFSIEKDFSMKRTIQAFAIDIESQTPGVDFSVVTKLPQEITKVVVDCATNADSNTYDYKNGEKFSYSLAVSGNYTFSFSFQDNAGVEYFKTTETVAVENATKSVSLNPEQVKVTPLYFSLADGLAVAAGDSLVITCNSSVSGIYYTTDGSMPNENSARFVNAVTIDKSMTVKAIAYLTVDGTQISSDVKTATYTVDNNLLKAPVISGVTEGKVYNSGVTISISNPNAEGDIYYALDGTEPSESNTRYSSDIKLSDVKVYTLRTVVKSGAKASAVVTVNFEIKKDTVSAPVFDPASGKTFSNTASITVTSSTVGASIYYTTDGSEPSESSTKYSGAISLTTNGDYTIRAVAIKDGVKSTVTTANYTVNISKDIVETPVITPATGTFTSAQSVTIKCNTTGADIYYTIDGSEPTESSTKYSNAFQVSATTTVKAIAVKSGYEDSSVATSTITINTPVNNFDGIQIQVAKSLGYNQIHYWTCSNAKYTATSWPGVAMDDTYPDDYIFEFEGADSVMLLITKSDESKLCQDDIKITAKGAYRITSSGAVDSTYVSKAPQPPTVTVPTSARVGGSFTITVKSSTDLTSANITIDGKSKKLVKGDNTFNVADFTDSAKTLSVSGSVANAAGSTSVTGSIEVSENIIIDGNSGIWNEIRMYQVMVSSFQDGDQSCGYGTGYGPGPHNGDLRGVINALDYIKDLGCNAVWMTPIFQSNGTSQLDSTGYFCNDYFSVDYRFGGETAFKELVEKAHEKGMYVILDGVFGHHSGVSKASPNGKYPSGGSNPVAYPGSLDYYTEVATYWIKNYKIDGWRFDQCYQVGLGDKGTNCNTGGHNYWYEIRNSIKSAAASNGTKGRDWGTLGYTVGEHWDGDAANIQAGSIAKGSAAGYGLQSCFDFPSRYKLVQMFATEESQKIGGTPLTNLDYVYSEFGPKGYTHDEGYWPNLFLTNHDLVRFGNLINWKYSENRSSKNYWKRHKVALASIAAYTGPITLYYGDEYGMMTDRYYNGMNGWYNDNMARDAGKISGFSFDEQDLHDYVAKLMNMRIENEVMWNGKHTTLKSDSSYFVGKKTLDGAEVIFIINNGSNPVSWQCSGTDLITGEPVSGTANCDGLSARFIKTK